MHKLWTVKVDGGNGKEIYGEDYADIWALNRLHFKAAMNRTCDHVSKTGVPMYDTHIRFEFSFGGPASTVYQYVWWLHAWCQKHRRA